VCALVVEQGGGETEACAALLHDAVEDQGGARTLARIRAELGDEVAEIVEALTDGPQEDWRERKQAYLDRPESEPADVLRVSPAGADPASWWHSSVMLVGCVASPWAP